MVQHAPHRRSILAAIAASIALASTCPIQAAQPQIGSTQAIGTPISQADWDAARELEFPKGVLISYRQTLYATMTPAEIDELARAVEGHPDHPDRLRLSIEQRRAKAPDVIDFQVWLDGRGRWRYNRTDHGQSFWVDITIDRNLGWSLTQDSLMVVDNSRPPENRDLASTGGELATLLRTLMQGDMGAAEATLTVQSPPQSSATRARFDTRFSNDLVRRYDLERSSPGNPWLPIGWEVLECPSAPSSVGTSKVFTGWHLEPEINGWIAQRVDKRDPSHRTVETIELLSVARPSESDFAAALALPTPVSTDVARGPSTIRSVFDYRPDHGVILSIGQDGTTRRPVPGLAEAGRISSTWRLVGWILAAILAATLMTLRLIVRRRRLASP